MLSFYNTNLNQMEIGTNTRIAYPIAYLNSLDISILLLATLGLKIGCPIILLRNLASKHGLYNKKLNPKLSTTLSLCFLHSIFFYYAKDGTDPSSN